MPRTASIALKSLLTFLPRGWLYFFCVLAFASLLDATGWHTRGVEIDNPSGTPFIITGVNWYGFETKAYVLGEAASHGWDNPIIFVEGISQYPTATGNPANGPYDFNWQGGQLQGVNGNAGNAGAPIVLNAGGTSSTLGAAVNNQLVYSAHDYGPSLFAQPWFTTDTCYVTGCSPHWTTHWIFINLGQVNPVWPGHASYPWSNTGSTAYTSTPIWLGEFGTGNITSDIDSTGAGSEGQWFTDLVNFINSSYTLTTANNSGYAVQSLNWTYWAFNGEDTFGILNSNYNALSLPVKTYSFLCFDQQGPVRPDSRHRLRPMRQHRPIAQPAVATICTRNMWRGPYLQSGNARQASHAVCT